MGIIIRHDSVQLMRLREKKKGSVKVFFYFEQGLAKNFYTGEQNGLTGS